MEPEDDLPAHPGFTVATDNRPSKHRRLCIAGPGCSSATEIGCGLTPAPDLRRPDRRGEPALLCTHVQCTGRQATNSRSLELIGLSARRRDLVRTFSRGMQQRLAIGRAVLHDPDVMLFDEPHTGLDQDAATMLDGILQEVAARGRTVVMTSHDLARAADLASRIDILSRGVITATVQRADIESSHLLSFYQQATITAQI
jgi:ABC-type dipeptide/oligopeptide/nickel transport system ATPase subunit